MFVAVLWSIGGLAVPIGDATLRIPGFLVVAAVLYAVLASGALTMGIARGFVAVSERKNQAEADYRYALTRVRENGEDIALLGGDDEGAPAWTGPSAPSASAGAS